MQILSLYPLTSTESLQQFTLFSQDIKITYFNLILLKTTACTQEKMSSYDSLTIVDLPFYITALTSPESTPSAWRPGITSAKPTSRVLYHSVTSKCIPVSLNVL